MIEQNIKRHYFLPHEFFFILYNLVYIIPVVYVYFVGFDSGGVNSTFLLTSSLLNEMILFYAVMIFSFFCGSRFLGFGLRVVKTKPAINKFVYSSKFLVYLSYIVFLCLLITKILLIKEGVYDSYAFDSGAMSSKVWTVSMGVTELLVALYIILLFTGNPKIAFICFIGIGLNLFHGTRIFTLISIFVYAFYCIYYKRSISGFKLALYAAIFVVSIMFVFLLVFILRSDITVDYGSLNFDFFISPLVYESVFNQVSFLKMIANNNGGIVPFAPHMLYFDSMAFILPNVFDAYNDIYAGSFGDLSPLGGLSGYASAIIYFSDYYFIWYFFLGAFLSFFFRLSRKNGYNILSRFIYVYFLCDTLFRLHRDPYFIVIKMLANNIVFIMFAFGISFLLVALNRGKDDCKFK